MPVFNKGISTYHSVQGLYWRSATGELLAVKGSNSQYLPGLWANLWSEISSSDDSSWSRTLHPSGKHISTLRIDSAIPALEHIRSNLPPSRQAEALVTRVLEIKHDDGSILGMVASRPATLADDAFSTWAEQFILTETELQPFAELKDNADPEHRRITEQVTAVFEKKLKNVSKDDQWHVCGREKFMNQVYGFVQKNQPILLALPAFPCKSPNSNKVGGIMPDLAENIALDVLRDFIKEANKVYQYGATMWVICDGHVFSDCIGADDDIIDKFDTRMNELYNDRYVEDGPVPAIKFKGLKDIFMSKPGCRSTLDEAWLASHDIPHPVETQRTKDAEVCRKLMLGIGEADRAYIRQCIDEQEEHTIQLYRGQTRFMLEDLAEVPSFKSLSNKQKKKTAANVAQEMMSRNQAYSNLVELLLPNYVRLSIHAHPNKGPKFAVRLLPKNMVRPIESLENRHEPVAAYEFQIPTPWHNSIIKVEGDELLYVARAEVAKKAIAGTDFEGSWVEGPNGSYFSLKRTEPEVRAILSAPTAPTVLSENKTGSRPLKLSTDVVKRPTPCMDIVSPVAAAICILSPVIEIKPLRKKTMSFKIHKVQRRRSFVFTSFFQDIRRYIATGV